MQTPRHVVTVDFPYDALVVAKGMRNPKTMQFLGRTAVEVREVDAADMIAAVRLSGDRPDHDLPARSERSVLYAFDGGLWAHLRDGEGRPVAAESFVRDCGHGARFRDGHPFALDGRHVAVADPAFRPFRVEGGFPAHRIEEVGIRKVLSSRRDEAAADAQRVADSLVFAGGQTFHRCHEPFWSAHPHRNEVRLVFGPENSTIAHLTPETFRADRAGDLAAWRRRWREGEKAFAVASFDGEVEMLAEGTLKRDDLAYLCRELRGLAERCFEFLREADAEALTSWAVVRDFSRVVEHSWSRETAMAALDALAVLRETFPRLPVRGIGYSRHTFESAYIDCRRLLARAHWFEGWGNPSGLDLEADDEAAVAALDEGPWPAAPGSP